MKRCGKGNGGVEGPPTEKVTVDVRGRTKLNRHVRGGESEE